MSSPTWNLFFSDFKSCLLELGAHPQQQRSGMSKAAWNHVSFQLGFELSPGLWESYLNALGLQFLAAGVGQP